MNNIFLFDIDGTLSKDGIIPTSAKRALEIIRKKGDFVLLSTGRCFGQMEDILKEIEVDGAITQNGGYTVLNGKEVSKFPIPKDVILRLMEDGYYVSILPKRAYLRIQEHKIFQEFADYFKVPSAKLDTFSILDEEIYSLGVYSYQADSIDFNKYPEIDFVRVAPLGYDVISKGVNKGSGIKDLRALYPMAKIIAFGDNYNDLEMLENADLAIVMPTAPKEVKKVSNFITKDVFEDGILYALKEYLRYED